jgi:hypothetical protein
MIMDDDEEEYDDVGSPGVPPSGHPEPEDDNTDNEYD